MIKRAYVHTMAASLSLLMTACTTSNPSPQLAIDRVENGPTSFAHWESDEQPMSVEGRARLTSFLEDHGSTSFLAIYQGKIALEFGDIHAKHLIHSIRKPILSLLYGKAVADGDIDLDETLGTLGLEEPGTPFISIEKKASVRELLQSRSAVYLPAAAETIEMASERPERGSQQSGEAYYYNNWSFNSLGSLFENRTGRSIYQAFDAQLAEPLGMADYANNIGSFVVESAQDATPPLANLDGFYLTEPDKSKHPAYHFRLSSHDLALIGQMLVNRGMWRGQQVIDPEWIDQTTKCYSVLNADIGDGRSVCYGMMWEVVEQDGRTSAFMHTGLGVHMIYVHPGAELVLIHRADTEDPDYERSGDVRALIGMTFGALN